MGGNDIDFTGIIMRAAVNVPFLEYSSSDKDLIERQPISKWVLSSKLEKIVNEVFPITKERLEESYKRIADRAGSQVHIIVAGYPKIISIKSQNAIFTKNDAELINSTISNFNNEIRKVVEKCQKDGVNISFVSVEDEFGDYGAYYPDENDELINRLKVVQTQDICDIPPISAYSIHPNDKGARVYADCVQKEIKRIEDERTRIWGQIVDDSSKPIPGVKVTLTDGDNKVYKTNTSDSKGNYGFELDYKEGCHYTVKFEAEAYKTLAVKEEKGGNRITINTKLKREGQANESLTDVDWKSIYKVKLQEKIKEYSGFKDDAKFELVDIDQNGIPELFISPASDSISSCEVYTISNGSIKQLDVVSAYGRLFYNEKEKTIVNWNMRQGVESCWAAQLIGDQMKKIYSSRSIDNGMVDIPVYQVNEENVTAQDYKKSNQKYRIENNSDWVLVGRKYSLNNIEIDTVLGISNS